MKKTKKILSLVLAVLMLVSVVPMSVSAAEQWWMPLTSYVSIGDPFGCTCSIHNGRHYGQDFPAYGGTTVRASKSGTVVAVVTYCKGSHYGSGCSCGSSWGNYVKIKHADGFYSLYAHLSSVSVSNGQTISQGQKVGGVGTTGDSTGNHLHFEIYNTSNTRVNPMNYVNPNNPSPSNEPTTIIYPTNGGIYKIASGVGNNMYLDFACTSDNVQIYENCDGHSNPDFVKSQYFKLTHVGDGWYTIVSTGNGKAMDIDGGKSASGTNIKQWTLDGNNAQLYRFYDAGNGYCYIKSKLGTYVDVVNGDNANNTNVWAYAFNGSNAQKWKLQSHSHSYSSKVTTAATCTKTGVKTFTCYCGVSYTETIAKTAHNKNITIPAVSATCTKTGLTEGKKCSVCGTITVAQQTVAKTNHTNRGEDNKCDVCGFVLVAEPTKIIYPVDGGIYKIAAGVGNNQHLDFSESTDNVKTYEGVDHPDQTFKLTHIGDGWYTIVSTGNGKAVDVEDANPACYTNVQQYELHNGDNQLFRFYDAGNGYCYIKSKLGCYVDVANGQNTNNTNVWMHTFNGGTPQKWKLQSHSHSYTSSVTTQPTCTKEGTKTYKCYCGASYTEAISKTAHNKNTTIPTVSATCTKTGLTEGKKCSVCGTITVAQQTVAIVPHTDDNADYKCDYNCGYEFEKPAPDTPDEPDTPTDPTEDCSCNCHKGGLAGLIFKIINFFQKLFGKNKVCACGVKH